MFRDWLDVPQKPFAATAYHGVMKAAVLAAALAAVLLISGCALQSNWHLVGSGYSIDRAGDGFAMEVHLNELKQAGGGLLSAEFSHYVDQRLKQHGLCKGGWAFLTCVRDGSCIQHTRRSVTVYGYCAAP